MGVGHFLLEICDGLLVYDWIVGTMQRQNMTLDVLRILGRRRRQRAMEGDGIDKWSAAASEIERTRAAEAVADRDQFLGVDHRIIAQLVEGRLRALEQQRPVLHVFSRFRAR